jgi:transposase
MPKKLDFQLTEIELLQVTEAIRKDKRPEVRQRATAIRLLTLGQKPAEVAESLATHAPTIYSWFHRFRQNGLEGLANQPKGRPKRKADEAYCQALEEAIEHDPGDYGYPFAVWTVERLRDYLERETGVRMSISRLRVVIRKQGFVYRRPKHDLTSLQDPDAKQQAKELLEALKKGHSHTTKSGSSLWTKRS